MQLSVTVCVCVFSLSMRPTSIVSLEPQCARTNARLQCKKRSRSPEKTLLRVCEITSLADGDDDMACGVRGMLCCVGIQEFQRGRTFAAAHFWQHKQENMSAPPPTAPRKKTAGCSRAFPPSSPSQSAPALTSASPLPSACFLPPPQFSRAPCSRSTAASARRTR